MISLVLCGICGEAIRPDGSCACVTGAPSLATGYDPYNSADGQPGLIILVDEATGEESWLFI